MSITKYYKNFILCGDVDYHCLLCNERFLSLPDIDKHLRWEGHRTKLKTQPTLPRLKNDGIYKVSNYYYCQHCNHVSYDMQSIKAHIQTPTHGSYKATPATSLNRIIARYDRNENVIIENVIIDRDYWNGIQDRRCALCNTDVTNLINHIDSQDHLVRLIQTKARYEDKDKCYREVNETTFQCFHCSKLFTRSDIEKHWDEHKLDINGDFGEPLRLYSVTEYNKLSNLEYDIEKLADITDKYYNIDIENKQITCKECEEVVKPTKSDLSIHMAYHRNYNAIASKIVKKIKQEIEKRYFYIKPRFDVGKLKHELAVYGKKNHIRLNIHARRGYCFLCDRFLTSNMNVFREHVNGACHIGHLEMRGQNKQKKHVVKPVASTECFLHYITVMTLVIPFEGVAVNCTYWVDRMSFLLLKRIYHGQHMKVTRCLVCDKTFKWWQEREHCETETHRAHILASKVVLMNQNMIREIKSKFFHCGACNITVPYWESLERHIKDRCHYNNTLQRNLAASIAQYKKYNNGALPNTQLIEVNNINNIQYANIIKVLFDCNLGYPIYTTSEGELKKWYNEMK